MITEVSVVDLFAGAGGFSVAAVIAGANLRLSVDIDDVCISTLKILSMK